MCNDNLINQSINQSISQSLVIPKNKNPNTLMINQLEYHDVCYGKMCCPKNGSKQSFSVDSPKYVHQIFKIFIW